VRALARRHVAVARHIFVGALVFGAGTNGRARVALGSRGAMVVTPLGIRPRAEFCQSET
jgi:hypothetical protein